MQAGCRRRRQADEVSWLGGMERRASGPARRKEARVSRRTLGRRCPALPEAQRPCHAQRQPAPRIPPIPGHPGRLGRSQPPRRRLFDGARDRAKPDIALNAGHRNGSGRRLHTRTRAPSRDGPGRCLATALERTGLAARSHAEAARLEAALNPGASRSGRAVRPERPEIKLPVCEKGGRRAFGARRLGFVSDWTRRVSFRRGPPHGRRYRPPVRGPPRSCR